MTAPKDRNATVTVCDKCLRASCFGGKFYCEDYRIARATRRTWKELDRLNREHRSYRMPDVELLAMTRSPNCANCEHPESDHYAAEDFVR